ncbi:MAG TPA: nickel-dependent lactate racemase [Candidatus Eisenbacteria bacterium]
MKRHSPIDFPYGRDRITWVPDPALDVTLVEPREPPPAQDPGRLIREALENPLGSPLLAELSRGAKSATIVVTDATRPCPDRLLVTPILETLAAAGIPDTAITLLVAIGMHRPSTPEEKIEKLGDAIVSRYRVVDSAPLDPRLQVDFGTSRDGVPITIDRRAADADLLIATGIVEPHQYAGFSGGWKTVAIGTAGAATITALHGMHYLEHPRVRLGMTDDNPFLDTARWVGEKAGLRFVVNVALDPNGVIRRVRAGHPETVHRDMSAWVRGEAIVPVDGQFPIVIGAAGHPKDSNLYQATRIPTYLCYARRPVVAPGGVILVPAACPEGAGQGAGERLFEEMLGQGGSPDEIIERARREGYPAGGQRAVMVAWAMKNARLAFVGTIDPELPRRLGMLSFRTLEEGVEWAVRDTGSERILAVPHALMTLPEKCE